MDIVRVHLVSPDCFSGVRAPREECASPSVISRPLFRIPRTRICGAVIDQIKVGIVRNPTPRRPAADFPLLALPGLYSQVRPAILRVEWLEILADQYVF